MNVIIIGGGSAGTTCAFELRKLNKEIKITIIEKSNNLEYSPCALPYVLSGEIKSFEDIFIFKKEDYEQNDIDILLNSRVIEINKKNKKIVYEKEKQKKEINYDKLVFAVGGSCFIPAIEGIEDINCFFLKSLEDAKKISKTIKKGNQSTIIGAGMIGVELSVSLAEKGEKVSLIEARENILPYLLDLDMSKKLKEYLEEKNIKIHENAKIVKIDNSKLIFENQDTKEKNKKVSFDRLFLCTGVKPNLELAKKIGLKINKGIIVNRFLQTSDENIFACGDCVESIEFNSNKKILSALGTTAVRQAKTIAQNLLKENKKFPEVLNNTITKIGDLYVGSVGLTGKRAKELGIKFISAKYSGNVRAEYYSNKEKITLKIICNEKGIVIGGQIIGHNEVVGRLDLLALGIQNKLHIKKIANLETCYNPPSAPIFDPLTITAEICFKKLNLMNS